MAQPYKSRVADSKSALLTNNDTPGAKAIRYYVKENGFKHSENGCEFRELVLLNDDGKEIQIIEGELNSPNGDKCWVYQGMNGWTTDAMNSHTMISMVKHYKEGQKARNEASLAVVIEQVKALKLANLPSTAIMAALKAQGVDSVAAEQIIKAAV